MTPEIERPSGSSWTLLIMFTLCLSLSMVEAKAAAAPATSNNVVSIHVEATAVTGKVSPYVA
jgi:hypothetical protein